MHDEVHALKDKVKAAHLNRSFPGKVGIEIPLNIKPDFEWGERLKRVFETASPGKKIPFVWDDHITLWVDKSRPETELEQLYSCIEEANNSYRVLKERRQRSELRREERRKKEDAELSAINAKLRRV